MDITNSQITKLKKMVTAAQEEFNMAVTYHEVWKPAAYDKDLHSRMGQSYASQAFLVMRIALRRETVLALMRLWDRNKQAVRMSLIVATIRKSAVIDALAADRATDHLAISSDDRAGPPFRQAHHGLQMRDAFALDGGPYHFFDRSSRSAAASNICSAKSFFSLAFSSSSCFSRLASEASIPPYLAFQL